MPFFVAYFVPIFLIYLPGVVCVTFPVVRFDGCRGLLADGGGLYAGEGDDGALFRLRTGLIEQDQLILS